MGTELRVRLGTAYSIAGASSAAGILALIGLSPLRPMLDGNFERAK